MTLATIKSVTIPVEIAFSPPFEKDPSFIAFSAFVDFIFFIDILINFRCTFVNQDGDEVSDLKKIAKKYVLGRFWIDLITVLPLKYI